MTKEQEPIKIDIEDEETPTAQPETGQIADELRNLGKQFAETLETAWNSEERQRVESEIREGVQNFAEELNKIFNEAKQSDAGQRVRQEAQQVKTKLEEAELGQKARSAIVQSLSWLSTEIGRLADRFTPPEKSPKDSES